MMYLLHRLLLQSALTLLWQLALSTLCIFRWVYEYLYDIFRLVPASDLLRALDMFLSLNPDLHLLPPTTLSHITVLYAVSIIMSVFITSILAHTWPRICTRSCRLHHMMSLPVSMAVTLALIGYQVHVYNYNERMYMYDNYVYTQIFVQVWRF